MYARRRSSLSFAKLTCLNIAFLTCCFFVIGHVSSMSLDRLGRQYQQQNDKQLQFSEFILPEAESEMLQNDLELVPALDGNSDMYLLVPASAVSQEQNLQTLTELSESQNSGNVESNSDMLMLETEDTPAVQVLELPEDGLHTKNVEELVTNGELDGEPHLANEDKEQALNDREQLSDVMINNIAEAAQEIKNEIETEFGDSKETLNKEELVETENSSNNLRVEHKGADLDNTDTSVYEQENPEQEMIGVVMEQSNKVSAGSLEDLLSKEFAKQVTQQQQKAEENLSKVEETLSDEKKSSAQTIVEETENERTPEIQSLNHVADDEHSKSEELKTPMTIEGQTIETNVRTKNDEETRIPVETEIVDEIQSEAQVLAQDQTVEDTEDTDEETETFDKPQGGGTITKPDVTKVKGSKGDKEEIQAETNPTDDETQAAAEITEIKQIKDKTQYFSVAAEVHKQQHMQPIKAELWENTHAVAEFENSEEIENAEVSANDDGIKSAESDLVSTSPLSLKTPDENQESQLTAESQIYEEFNPADEEVSASNAEGELALENNLQSDHNSEESEPAVESPQVGEVQDVEKVPQIKENVDHVENAEAIREEAQPIKTQLLDNQNAEETQNVEIVQPVKETQPIEGFQNAEDIQTFENIESVLESQTITEVEHIENVQNEESSSVENMQAGKGPQYNEGTEAVEETEPDGNIPSVEQSQPDDNVQTFEETKLQDLPASVHEPHSVEDAQTVKEDPAVEQTQPIKNIVSQDDLQIGDLQHSAEGETKPTEENGNKVEVLETVVEGVKPVVEMESSPEEIGTEEDTPNLMSLPEMQQTEAIELAAEQQSDENKPVEIADDKFIAEESNAQKEEHTAGQHTAGQPTVLGDKNVVQNIYAVNNNSDNILNYNKTESELIKENTSMLTSILQVPTKEELAQQQQQAENEHKQDQQAALVETISSATLKPFNVLDSVLNYVNASFMNQLSNDNTNNIKQEFKDEDQVFSSKLRRYDGAQVWRIVVQNDRERKLADELQTKFDGQLWKEVKQEVDYLLKPQVLADAEHHVRAANLSRIVLIDNLQKVIEVENPPAEEIAQLQNRNGCRLTWQAYHRLEDIHAYFDYLAKTYPDICSVETIGYSIEKRPLKILKISNGNANNTGVWIDGGMHAREWISPAVVTYITHQIVEGWDDLPAYMRNINWYMHAVANPDGYEYSHTTDRLWRKNMRSHGRACPGVDLNRNFGYKWGGKGTSANPCAQTYRGSKAFSEPETFYISKFISNLPRGTFKGYLSFHSYGQYILYPWGYDYYNTQDMTDLDVVARQAGTIITKSSGAKFIVGSSATTLYPAAGGSDDWAKGIAGIKYAYTIEMGDTGRYGFILPASYIESNGKNGLTFVETVAKAITMGKNGRKRKLKALKTH